jgi:uncharacterized repeat protein (TIGR01451 family)
MSALRSFRRGRNRGLWVVGATLLAAAAFGVIFVASSGAAPSPCPIPGNFEIDGDMTQQTCAPGADDWNTPNIGVQATTQGGTYSTSGKDGHDPSTWTSSGHTPDKTNFAQEYATSRVVNGHFFVYVAWERTATSGTQGYAIEISNAGSNVAADGTPQPNRASGGNVFYISSQGSSPPAFNSACTYSSQSNYGQTCTTSNASVTAAINTASMSDPLNNTTQPAGAFFEVALDVTTLTGIAPSCPGPSAATVYLRSITGQTKDGNLKGYMAPLSVAPDSTCVPPPITTTATPGGSTNLPGTAQHDTVSVNDGTNAGVGTVKFFLCSPSEVTTNGGDCTKNGTQVGSAVTLDASGNGTSGIVNGASTPNDLAPGKYCWRAEFTAGANDHHFLSGSETNSDSECFTVIKASPSISTNASRTGGGVVGTGTTCDSATLSGSFNGTGTITFTLKAPNNSSSQVGSPVTVTGDGTYQSPSCPALTQVGTYTWSASYSGDSLNNGAIDNGDNESVTSIKASPSIKTQASVTGNGIVGTDSTSDTATVSGGDNPTGTIQFSITDPNNNTTTVGSPVTVNGDGTYNAPSSVALTLVGTYTWSASYSGDSLNNGAIDNGDNESVTSIKASPSIKTQASVTGNGIVGTDSTSDTATVSGGDNPTGTIQFSITDPNNNTTTVGSPVTVNGDGTYNAPSSVALTLVGTYTWSASYSGDSLNNGAIDNGDNESVTSIKASPSIKTQASVTGNGIVGTDSTSDTATVSGGDNPTGTIQFSITDPNNNTTTVGSPVTVNGDGTYNAPSSVALTLVGTYTWSASYSGDSLNNGAIDNGNNESITSIPTTPSITTEQAPASGSVGDTFKDEATLSGTFRQSGKGSITWTLYPNDDCSGTPLGTDMVSVDDNGTFETPNGVTVDAGGTYYWVASFSGDANNGSATSGCADEPVVVHGAAIHIVKKADAARVSVGGQIGFTMTVWNSGDGDAHGVKLNDVLPTTPGLAWTIDKHGAGWGSSCSIAAGVLSCGGSSGVTVPAGTTQSTSTFTVHITSTTTAATAGDCPASGVVDNTGSVTTTNDGSDQSSASTCVQAMVDLSITKSGSPATQQLGAGNITWTIVVTNHGPNADTGVKITDPMPAGNTFVSASASPHGTCTGGGILTCDLGTMAADESVTITLVTTPSAAGAQTNTVNVSGNRPETNTTNNSATATVEVTAAPITPPQVFCVAVSKVTPKQLFVGRKTTLNIHVTKQGKAVKGIHVQIKGPKLNVRTKASNSKGAIKQTVKMKKAGVLIFTPIASKKCNTKRVGVTNVFTPPVTG